MAERTFSPGYYPAGELEFQRAIKEADYDHAARVLESFPFGRNDEENALRVRAIIQGYRALTKVLIETREANLADISNELGVLKQAHEKLNAGYQNITKRFGYL